MKRIQALSRGSVNLHRIDVLGDEDTLSINGDIAVAFDVDGTNVIHFGRLIKLLALSKNSKRFVLDQPVLLDDVPIGTAFVCEWYSKVKGSKKYVLNQPDTQAYSMESFLGLVKMKCDKKSKAYILADDKMKELEKKLDEM